MKTAKTRQKRVVSEVRQVPQVQQHIKRNIATKQNPYTRRWYVMEEESCTDYMKLRYSTVEFSTKTEANNALTENQISFNRWEVF